MKVTFTKLAKYMEKHQTHDRVAGRTADYIIPNSMGDGQHIMMTKKMSEDVVDDVEMYYEDRTIMELGLDEDNPMAEIDDAYEGNEDVEEGGELEVEDDGDLDSL